MHCQSRFMLAAIGMIIISPLVEAASQAPPSAPVTVVNTPSNPVPVTGSTTVSGSVAATQSGAWNVNVRDPGIANPFEGVCDGQFRESGQPSASAECIIGIPAGYQLVVQAVSAAAAVEAGVVARFLQLMQVKDASAMGGHFLPFLATGPAGGGAITTFTLAHPITWYFDPTTNGVSCNAVLSKQPSTTMGTSIAR